MNGSLRFVTVILLPLCNGDQVVLYFLLWHRPAGDDDKGGGWRKINQKPCVCAILQSAHQSWPSTRGWRVNHPTLRFVSLSLPELGCFFSDHTNFQLSGLKVHVEDG